MSFVIFFLLIVEAWSVKKALVEHGGCYINSLDRK